MDAEEGHLRLPAAPAAQRKDAVGIAVRAHFQAVEILRLRAEARVGDFDVVSALSGEGEIEARIEASAGTVVTAR